MKSLSSDLTYTCQSLEKHESVVTGRSTGNESGNDARLRILPRETVTRIPGRGLYTEEARLERLVYLRNETATALSEMDACSLQADRLTGNIENLIGSIEIPVGIAGPLLIHGEKADGNFYLPMATSEGSRTIAAIPGGRSART